MNQKKNEREDDIEGEEEKQEAQKETISDAEEREGRPLEYNGEDLVPWGVGDPPKEASSEPPDDFEIKTFHLALPMLSKKSLEVTKTAMEMVLRLRMDGYTVNHIHADQGHEFAGNFAAWCRKRGILLTKTAGDEPQSNGRAEATVKKTKTMIRKALHHGGKDAKWWPWAARYVNEVLRCHRIYETPSFPTFMESVMVRKRRWQKEDLGPTVEEVKYLAPSVENHGHWIVKEGEAPRLTRCIMKKLDEKPSEAYRIALERDLLDGLTLRRRLRQKTTIKVIQGLWKQEEEDQKKKERAKVKRLLEDEMMKIPEDDPELAVCSILLVGRMKKFIEEGVNEEEEEILQTKIISPKEVAREWLKWKPSAEDEVNSLLVEKNAMVPLTADQVRDFIDQAKKRGLEVELIPSKLVFAKKPGKKGGKRKVRWVICGNFETKQPDESNYSGGRHSES